MDTELVRLKTGIDIQQKVHKMSLRAVSSMKEQPENLILRARTFFHHIGKHSKTLDMALDPNPPALIIGGPVVLSPGCETYFSPDDKHLVVINSKDASDNQIVTMWSTSNWIPLYEVTVTIDTKLKGIQLACIWFPDSQHYILTAGSEIQIRSVSSAVVLQ